MTIKVSGLLVFLCCIGAAVYARETDNPAIVIAGGIPSIEAKRGDSVSVTIPLKIAKGYHVNANPAATDFYIPIEITVRDTCGILFGKPEYPPSKKWRLKGTTDDLWVYDGAVALVIPAKIRKDAAPGRYSIRGIVDFQACDEEACLMPDSRPITITIAIQ
jgi:hypothetical protein